MSEYAFVPNESTSEVITLTPSLPTTSDIGLSPSLDILSNIHKEARNLGVISDSELSFDQSTAVLFCAPEAAIQGQVISFPRIFRKAYSCFYLIQTRLLQCTLFWYQQVHLTRTSAVSKCCCQVFNGDKER